MSEVYEKLVIKLNTEIVVKFAPGLDISEVHTMSHIWPYSRSIPILEPLGAISIGQSNYIFMSCLEGVTLTSVWSSLDRESKSSVRLYLGAILQSPRLDNPTHLKINSYHLSF